MYTYFQINWVIYVIYNRCCLKPPNHQPGGIDEQTAVQRLAEPSQMLKHAVVNLINYQVFNLLFKCIQYLGDLYLQFIYNNNPIVVFIAT